MRASGWALLWALLSSGCHRPASSAAPAVTPARAAAIHRGVRAFASAVAEDVTKEGPAAWGRHFADSPAFYMAADGHLVFPDRAAATAGLQQLVQTLPHIELRWGEDLRVDVLATDLAGLAASYHEVQVDAAGRRAEDNGYFTAVVEEHGGRWQFRNAHWSSAAPAAAVP